MPLFESFLGPSYASRSRTVSDDKSLNVFSELVESGTGKSKYCLYGRPGNALFSDMQAGPGQGMLEVQDRCFAVAGGFLYEVNSIGAWSKIGSVGTLAPVSMAANATQVIITSITGGGWLLPLANVAGYGQITSPGFPINCDSVTYQDTYFIATQAETQNFFISAPDDGTSWDPLDFAAKEGNPDFIAAVMMVRRQLWVFGTESSEIWWDSGQANFPFQPIQGALVEVGLEAVRSPAIVGNGLFWLGKNNRGHAVAFAEQNFAPIRVSNHAIESAWSQYTVTSDAIGYGYEENGHTFYVLSFPTANATWVLDTRTGFWHEWDWWSIAGAISQAALARFHCFCFGQHLVLDYQIGNVWTQSLNIYQDAQQVDGSGTIIRRLRRSPHIDQAKHRQRHVRFELDMEVGVVPQGGNPLYSLRYSDDGGFTWSNELIRGIGKLGKYKNQVVWRQLGSSRDRIYEVYTDSNCSLAWAACYLEIAQSTEQQ